MNRVQTAIFISGRGSNMMALVEASRASDFPAQIRLVVSNDPAALGLKWAKSQGIETFSLDHTAFGKDRAAHEAAIDKELKTRGIEFICLAGYMRVLSDYMVLKWQGKMINIHPSLLPKYRGLHTHQRALDAGDDEHGCTVHWVSIGVDEGAIIAQARVPIFEDDTPEILADRLLIEEHKLYPRALRQVLRCEK